MEDKPKFSKLAVASFVLALSSILVVVFGFLIDFFIVRPEFPAFIALGIVLSSLTTLVALVFSIISLRIVKRDNLRGKGLALTSLIVSCLMLLPALMYGIPLLLYLIFQPNTL